MKNPKEIIVAELVKNQKSSIKFASIIEVDIFMYLLITNYRDTKNISLPYSLKYFLIPNSR